MKQYLDLLYNHQTLSRQEAKGICLGFTNNQFHEVEMAAFLSAIRMRPLQASELLGFRDAILEQCITVDLSGIRAMDLCGTGGDGKNTFNISTLSSLVVAACGIPVAKHGNYGSSSASGSSNVLEALGVSFESDSKTIKNQIETLGISFLHAPLFHPSMKYVAPVRKQLRIKTIFNLLGPLVNPTSPEIQVTGVYNHDVAKLYQSVFLELNSNSTAIHDFAGYDEISLTSSIGLYSKNSINIVEPSHFNLPKIEAKEIYGGATIKESAQIFINVLENKATLAQKNVILANSALAIHLYNPKITLLESVEKARDAIDSKKALNLLQKLQSK